MWGGKSIGMYYKSEETGKELFIAINMETNDEKAFTHLPAGDKNWKKLLDTQSYFDTKGHFDENSSADKKKSQNILWNNCRLAEWILKKYVKDVEI